jgi:hypothetical protein
MDGTHNVAELRAKANAVSTRARSDAQYRAQIEADPIGMLGAAGIPALAARELLAPELPVSEVEGYVRCADTTCWISIWPSKCFITVCKGTEGATNTF